MHLFSLDEIIEATGGIRVGVFSESMTEELSVRSVSTDTRLIEPESLFIALVGERFNGHDFCRQAFEKGALLQLISDERMLPQGAVGILVQDTLTALHDLARAYRRKLACKVIAVTGSVGKTSTREMLNASLSGSMRTHATKNNLNNEIGLPLTILSAPVDTELLILEMGMRMRGEILSLTKIAEPDIAIITNIGVSHIERLGSQQEILLAKTEICEGLTGDKLLLVNGDDRLLTEYIRAAQNQPNPAGRKWKSVGVTSLKPVHLPKENFDYADLAVIATNLRCDSDATIFSAGYSTKGESGSTDLGEFYIPCVGEHHVKNALFSICCALHLGIDVEDVKKGLLTYTPTGSRGRIIHTENYLIYDDAYNASPESMAAAFESVRMIAGERRKIAAIGGILELGAHASEQHYQVGIQAAQSGMDQVFVCGDNRKEVESGIQSINPRLPVKTFETRDKLTDALLDELKPGDVVLVKASHAFEMEKVVESILSFESRTNYSSRKEDQA